MYNVIQKKIRPTTADTFAYYIGYIAINFDSCPFSGLAKTYRISQQATSTDGHTWYRRLGY